jgi:predicted Rossmann fold flavoprotein
MIVVIGGGPAGFFAAITARETDPSRPVVLLEKNASVLAKVKVSGGGRCNVTHACDEPRELAAHYPRGSRELLGPFHKWGPQQTVAWFASRGVDLKTETDGRMFPVTESSATIVGCLVKAAREAGVEVRTRTAVRSVDPATDGNGFAVKLEGGEELVSDRVLLATGGKTSSGPATSDGYSLAQRLGHSLVAPVPSLFTFRIEDALLAGLEGVSVPRATVGLAADPRKGRLEKTGPVLVTHRGLSGPAVLGMSAWGARRLHEMDYRFPIEINWLPGVAPAEIENRLLDRTRQHGKQNIRTAGPFGLPRRLWTALAVRAGVAEQTRWADLDRRARIHLLEVLTATRFEVTGKDTFKEEFVTCGGVPLGEIDLRTMASRVCPGLFLAGELLDIDGVTGGFNFQSCWTTGHLAGRGMVEASP